MSIEDSHELIEPQEGFSTLSAQITKRSVDRITRIIQKQKEKGKSDDFIAEALKKDLSDYDPHTRKRLQQLAERVEIADDFPEDIIDKKEEVKEGTAILTLRESPEQLGQFSLVRLEDKDWLVTEIDNNNWTLKAL